MKDISILVDDVKFNFRVGVIFEYNDSIIIEKGDKANFGVLPGGRVMTLEDTKSALIREVQEEMHFDISKKEIKLQDIIENFFTYNGAKYHELYFVYKVKLEENDEIVKRKKGEFINYDSESNYYEYINLDDIDNESIKPEIIKKIVKDNKFNTIVVRE
ncbi:MAG: NUDIX domain-containing protein [Clostridia bacterium]